MGIGRRHFDQLPARLDVRAAPRHFAKRGKIHSEFSDRSLDFGGGCVPCRHRPTRFFSTGDFSPARLPAGNADF
jgi:hypothetical protein